MKGVVELVWDGASQGLDFRVLTDFWEKLYGLLGTAPDAKPVVLLGCGAIHTHGMSYPLDVALVSKDGSVLASRRGLMPGRRLAAKGAWYAFERPSSSEAWPAEGAGVRIVEKSKRMAIG